MKIKATFIFLLLAAPLIGRSAPERAPALRADAIQAHIVYLASDELTGRGSGTKGNEMAARYIAAQFRRAGLAPIGTKSQNDADARIDGSGYFQPFRFVAGVARGKSNKLEIVAGDTRHGYRANVEFAPSTLSTSGEVKGDIIFAGYGIVSQEAQRDDYAKLDVKGKIVLILAGAPGNDPHSPLFEAGDLRRKAMTAREHGALALILIPAKNTDLPPSLSPGASDAGLPIVVVRRDVAESWLKSAGKSLESVESSPVSYATGIEASLRTDVQKVVKTTANIAGLLEGSDPGLKSEVVVIGAHMDHLGMGGPGSLAESKDPAIHHGADDNASGSAGVMALAEYFAHTAPRPRRSLLFICFSGEELGLLGSAHYVRKPIIPIDRTIAMLNMDMVGRMEDNKLIVSGTGTSPGFSSLVDVLNAESGFKISKSDSGFGASDQQSFYTTGIPVLFFFTGLHADYHKPSDTADKINSEGESRVVEYVARCAVKIADTTERPEFKKMAAQESAPARFRVSLGSIPDYAADVEGVLLSGVRPGSPADKAGLKKGDIIIKFGEHAIRNVQDYTVALSEHKPGDEVEIMVKRGSETVKLKAVLAGSSR